MAEELRKSGIDVIGDVPWGMHFCQFYETKKDLADVLVPYFKAGLENNEFCMWVTADPLNVADARRAMRRAMPDFQSYVKNGQIEIMPYSDWYLKDGSFDSDRVLNGWVDKLNDAQARGFAGLRLTGNTFWLEPANWKSFTDYEAAVDAVIGKYRMVALCTYSLAKCGAFELLDVISNHRFALIKRGGSWQTIESTRDKELRQALARSEEASVHQASLLATVSDAIYATDSELKITSWNKAAEAMYGWRADEAIGQEVHDLLKMQYVGTTKEEAFSRLYAEGQWKGEVVHQRKDGAHLTVQVSRAVLFGADGLPSGMVSVARDVSRQKAAEDELREARSYLNNLLDYANAPVIVWDPSFRITLFNHAFERLTGLNASEAIGRQLDILFPPDSREQSMLHIQRALAGERWEVVEIPILRTDGEVRTVLWNSATIFDSDGKTPVATIAQGQDITERKQSEEALRRSEDLLKQSQEMARVGSWELDLARDRLYWSDEVYRLFGLAPQEFGATYGAFLDAVHPDDRSAVDAAYSDSVQDGKDGYEIEHRIVQKSTGEIRYVHEKCQHIRNADGKITRSIGMVHDITERKKAEDALRETRDYLNNLLDYANAPVIVWDPSFRITLFNHAFERLTGLKAAEAIGKQLDILFPSDSREQSMGYIKRALAGERWEVVEIPILRTAGEVRMVLWNSATIYGSDGKTPQATIAQGQDITDRKLAEQNLLKEKEFSETAINSLPGVFYVFPPGGRFVRWNRNFEVVTGYTREEFAQKTPLDLFEGADRQLIAERIGNVFVNGVSDAEANLSCKDGRKVPYYFTGFRMVVDGVPYLIGAGVDITERKKAEDALRETRDYLNNLLDYANAPIIVWDPSFRITLFNHAFERLTGLKAGEAIGKQLDILFPPDSREQSMEYIKRAVAGERWEVVEIPILRAGGEVRMVLWNSATIYGPDGKTPQATIAQGQDITERKQAEEALRLKTDELERSNKELEQFAYIASHDLQEPLRMVSSYVQLLGNRYRGKLDQDADEFIHYATDGAARMQKLINDLLVYSRVGTRGVAFEPVNLELVLAQALDNLKMTVNDSGAAITHDTLPVVRGDPGQLTQVFQNLIDNAIKFHGDAAPAVHVSARVGPRECVVSVRDNGIGIAPEYISRLFVLFQRLHARSEYPGTGIGLAICKRIVERHGGRVWVESQPGAGSTFFFSLPLIPNT